GEICPHFRAQARCWGAEHSFRVGSKPVYHWLMSRLATALCLTAAVCLPQSPSTDPFLAWLDRIAQQQLDDRERAIAGIRTQADADRRKAMVRAKLTELI